MPVRLFRGFDLTLVESSLAGFLPQDAVTLGLQVLANPAIEASAVDWLEISAGAIVNRTAGRRFAVEALPETTRAFVEAVGLTPYTRKRLIAQSLRPRAAGRVPCRKAISRASPGDAARRSLIVSGNGDIIRYHEFTRESPVLGCCDRQT